VAASPRSTSRTRGEALHTIGLDGPAGAGGREWEGGGEGAERPRGEGSGRLAQVVTESDPELLQRRVHLIRHGLR